MYGNELVIENPSDHMIDVQVRKRENQAELVDGILSDGRAATWATEVDHLILGERIRPHSERRLQVVYRQQAHTVVEDRSLRFELSVATRRMLSEFRDDYLSRSRTLSTAAANFKNALTRAS